MNALHLRVPALAAQAGQSRVIPVRGAELLALLLRPTRAPVGAVVLGVLGPGMRFSTANRLLASTFAQAGLAVLVVELLTDGADDRHVGVGADLPLLAERLCDAVEWLAFHTAATEGGVGLVGLGAVGAAALVAAAANPELTRAVVCAAAPLDHAATAVLLSQTPTLVVVGDQDRAGLSECGHLVPCLRCEHRLEVIVGAGPRFVEPGALEQLMRRATAWLLEHLVEPAPSVA